jgi:hypothetical protein
VPCAKTTKKNSFRQNVPRQDAERSIRVSALIRECTNFIITRTCPSLLIGGYAPTRLSKAGNEEVKESGECLLLTKEATGKNINVLKLEKVNFPQIENGD